jgi:ZIP family zinc transporter
MLTDVFIASFLAGAATAVGGALVLLRKPGVRMYNFLMGFAGGVMLSLAFTQLLGESIQLGGLELAIAGFSVGAFAIFVLDTALPHMHFATKEKGIIDLKMLKLGTLIAIGIALHNLPEGMAVAAGYASTPALGVLIAIGIALHNIPEGIATALPLREAGLSKKKTFVITMLSGLAEPLGALLIYFFLSGFPQFIPMTLAFAAGVMVFITLDEILVATKEKHQHSTPFGILIGIIFVMILSKMFGI